MGLDPPPSCIQILLLLVEDTLLFWALVLPGHALVDDRLSLNQPTYIAIELIRDGRNPVQGPVITETPLHYFVPGQFGGARVDWGVDLYGDVTFLVDEIVVTAHRDIEPLDTLVIDPAEIQDCLEVFLDLPAPVVHGDVHRGDIHLDVLLHTGQKLILPTPLQDIVRLLQRGQPFTHLLFQYGEWRRRIVDVVHEQASQVLWVAWDPLQFLHEVQGLEDALEEGWVGRNGHLVNRAPVNAG